MKTLATLLSLFVLIFSSCATGIRSQREPQSAHAVLNSRSYPIIATTDFHGGLEEESAFVGIKKKEVKYGGAEAFSAYIKALREHLGDTTDTKENSLLIDGGDLFQGTMLSNRYEGAPVIRFYQYIGVDAAALGNHEFDFGPAGEKAVPTAPGDDAQGALKQRMFEASRPNANIFPANTNPKPFKFLAANVVKTPTDAERENPNYEPLPLAAYETKMVNGVLVGIIGISDKNTPSTTNALNLVGLEFQDPAPVIQKTADFLRESKKVESVVLVAHTGAICEDNRPEAIDDISSCKKSHEIFDIIDKLQPGTLDFVSAGHTHRTVFKRHKGTLVIQAGSNSKYIGWAKVTIGAEGQGNKVDFGGLEPVCVTMMKTKEGLETCDSYELNGKDGEVVPAQFLGKPVKLDKNAAKLFAKEAEEVAKLKKVPVGDVTLDSEFTYKYEGESTLGNMVADMHLEMRPGADIGMTNGGGLRSKLPEGKLIYNSIFRLAPFDNQLAFITVKGDKLRDMMRIGAFGAHGAYVWSKNVTFDINRCNSPHVEDSIENIFINNEPLDLNKTYRVATSDYLAGGGSGIKELNLPKDAVEIFWDKEFILRDAMVKVLSKWNRPLTALEFYDPKKPRQNQTSQNCD